MRIDRKLISPVKLSLAVAGSLLATGCQQAPKPPPQSTPLVVDEAMQKREWPQSVVYVGNGNVDGTSTGGRFTPETNDDTYKSSTLGTYQEGVTQFTGGLLNVLAVPFSPFFPPENATNTSNGGVTVEPSFTGITPPSIAPEPGTLSNANSPPSPGNQTNAPPSSGTPAPGAPAPTGAGPQSSNPGTPPGADNPTGTGSTPAPGGGAGGGVLDK